MNKQILLFLDLCEKLDSSGKFVQSDKLFNKFAQYYPQQSVTKVPHVHFVEYEEIEELSNSSSAFDLSPIWESSWHPLCAQVDSPGAPVDEGGAPKLVISTISLLTKD